MDFKSVIRDDLLFNGKIPGICVIYFAVFLEACQEMPPESANEFQIINTAIPAVKKYTVGIELPILCFLQHISKMIIFGFSITIFMINSKIYRVGYQAVCPN